MEHPSAPAETRPPGPEPTVEVIIPARTAQKLAVGVGIAAFVAIGSPISCCGGCRPSLPWPITARSYRIAGAIPGVVLGLVPAGVGLAFGWTS